MKLYTLRGQIENAPILNGRILMVKQLPNGHALFVDAQSRKPLWETTTIKKIDGEDEFLTITTSSGSIYKLITVESLLLTKRVEPEKVEDTSKDILVPINMVEDRKDIHYCDGYYKVTYTFNRDISREEFIEFLKERNYHNARKNPDFPKDKEDAAWYEDYDVIEGSGKTWTYTWVKRYTD